MHNYKKHLYALLILGITLISIDQIIKIYIKTNFLLGEERNLLGTWFKVHFIENDGMAYGLKFSDSQWAKLLLTIFRFFAISYGFVYLFKHILPKKNLILNYVVVIILAGAVGNLIDSLFYGIIFSDSPNVYTIQSPAFFTFKNAYGHFLQGKVVDMIYCPIIRTTLPKWVPIWGGQPYEFFSPVFNFADTCISTGVGILIVFNKKFLQLFK